MAITLLDSANGQQTSGPASTAVTGNIDATGATMLWAIAITYNSAVFAISDSHSNHWHACTSHTSADSYVGIFYACDKDGAGAPLEVDATLTITNTAVNYSYPTVIGGACSGSISDIATILVGQNGANNSNLISGDITPSAIGDWILAAICSDTDAGIPNDNPATDFTTFEKATVNGGMQGSASAKNAANTSAQGATWTGGSGDRPCAIAVFKAAAGATATTGTITILKTFN